MSGIYIPGLEMPKDGFITVTITSDGRVVGNSKRESDKFEYLDNEDIATAIPVPDHGRQDGLYSKYFVIKTETGEIVQDCFVLRPQKDKAAVAALLLYAEETESQELSSDIRGWLSTIIPASKEGEG